MKLSEPFAKLPYGFLVTLGCEFNATVQKVWLPNNQLWTPLGNALLLIEIGRQDHNYVSAFNMKYVMKHRRAISVNRLDYLLKDNCRLQVDLFLIH